MAGRVTQYEHLPHVSEEQHYEGTDGRYDPYLSPQSYEVAQPYQPQVSTTSERTLNGSDRRSQESHGSRQYHHNGFKPPNAHENPLQSLGSSNPKANAVEKRSKASFVDRMSDWWWWEIESVLLSLACLIAIIITLSKIQGRPLASWHSSIAPNALISTLATVSKASLMLAVTGCISQIKWVYFKNSSHPLHDIQTFDDASRGPLGALELITRLSPKKILMDRSAGAGWAFWASILTILALALDPFAQQILSFPQRSVPAEGNREALIYTAQIYDTDMGAGLTATWSRNIDVHMQGAVMNGLYTLDSPAQFTCTTAECTWPTFYSIGVCSSCTNVTGRTNATCTRGAGQQNCNYTLPSGLGLKSRNSQSSGGGFQTSLNATARVDETGSSVKISNSLATVAMIRIDGANNKTYENPEGFDCRISWCAKRFSGFKVTNGTIATPNIHSWRLESPNRFYQVGNVELNPFTVPESEKDFDGPNRTFTVNANDHKYLANWLATSFFRTMNQEAVARALYVQPNVSQTFDNIATSMTNKIREGRNSTTVQGTAFRQETFIKVNWAWLILPGVVVVMGIVLLAASIFLSRGRKEELWKNSILAAMFMQVKGPGNATVGRWSDMGRQAKSMKGKMESNAQGGYDFVRP